MVIQYLGQGEVRVSQGERALIFAGKHLWVGGRGGFEIDGPGEYEVDGTFVKGIESEHDTIYSVLFEEVRFCYLGTLVQDNLSAEAKEAIGEIDVLFVSTDNPKLSSVLEPKIVVPLYREKSDLQKFLKEIGEKGDLQDKLLLKRKNLEGKESEVVCLSF